MIDESRAREVVDAHIGTMRDALCANRWTITSRFGRLDQGWKAAEIEMDCPYMQATITFDVQNINDEDDLLHHLRHELLHLAHSEWIVYANISNALIGSTGRKKAAERSAFNLAIERTNQQLEMIMDNLGFTPRKLAGIKDED